jgi:glycerol-3-phosphate O-acyltransferase
MVVHSFLRNSNKPIVFVPVYVGYDKVAEVATYQNELRGAKKKTESVGQLVKARSVLKTKFGKVYLGFGEPLYLKDYLDARQPSWRDAVVDSEEKPTWMHPIVTQLGDEVLTRINSTAVVSPIGLVSLVLLSVPTHALPEEDLLLTLDKMIRLMRLNPYSADVVLPPGEAREILSKAMGVSKIERFQHPGGDVIHVDDVESVMLGYYRNNILHLTAVPSLVAAFYQHNDRVSEATLKHAIRLFYPFLQKEFFLRFSDAESEAYIDRVVDSLVEEKLLYRESGSGGVYLRRPDVTSPDLSTLHILARVVGKMCEKMAISSVLLVKQASRGPVNKAEFEKQCQLMAQRTAILNGSNDVNTNDQAFFSAYFLQLEELGYIKKDANLTLSLCPNMEELAECSMMLLSEDLRQSISRMATGQVQLSASSSNSFRPV